MKKAMKFETKMVVAALCVAAAGLVAAQSPNGPISDDSSTVTANRNNQPQAQKETAPAPGQPMKVNKCSHMIGTAVENLQGDKLGKIEDVVVDFGNGRVSYCVLRVEQNIFTTP